MSVNAGLLPREVLLEIFSYCSYYDLVESIRSVCRWWQEVSQDKSLWQQIEYIPLGDSKERIINLFRTSPFLRAVNLVRCLRRDEEICKELIVNCPFVEVLSIYWESLLEAVVNCVIVVPLTSIKTLKIHAIDHYNYEFDWIHAIFPNVEHLELNVCRLMFAELDFAWYLRVKQDVLHTLSLHCRTEDGCVLPYLSACTSLKTLTLTCLCYKAVTNALCVSELTLCHSLLDVGSLKDFPHVVHLQLTHCFQADGDFFPDLALCCPALSQLTLHCSKQAPFLDDANLTELYHLKSLTHLCILYSYKITDKSVEQLKDLPNLTKLDLYGCVLVTPICLKDICTFSKLEVLRFDLNNSTVDLTAGDVVNRDVQFMFYNCPHEMLEWFRKQHLRVCSLGKMHDKHVCV